jgi:hypothetical protein
METELIDTTEINTKQTITSDAYDKEGTPPKPVFFVAGTTQNKKRKHG